MKYPKRHEVNSPLFLFEFLKRKVNIMNEAQANEIIILLENISSKLSELEGVKSHLMGLENDVEDIKEILDKKS